MGWPNELSIKPMACILVATQPGTRHYWDRARSRGMRKINYLQLKFPLLNLTNVKMFLLFIAHLHVCRYFTSTL